MGQVVWGLGSFGPGFLFQGPFSWVPWSRVQWLCGQGLPALHTLLVLYDCGPIIIGSNADTLITASF